MARASPGNLIAVVEDAGTSAELVLRQAVVEHLRRRLQELGAEEQRLRGQIEQEVEAAVQRVALEQIDTGGAGTSLALVGAVGVLLFAGAVRASIATGWAVAYALCGLLPSVAAVVTGVRLMSQGRRRAAVRARVAATARQQAEERRGQELARLGEEMEWARARIAELTAEIDELARQA